MDSVACSVVCDFGSISMTNIRWNPAGLLTAVAVFVCVAYLLRQSLPFDVLWFRRSSQISVRELLCVAIRAAESGGAEVRRVRDANVLNAKSKGGLKNPVTDGDLSSHNAMMATLTSAFAHLKIISEEHDTPSSVPSVGWTSADRSCPESVLQRVPNDAFVSVNDVQMWIDPLDATQEYTEDLLQYVTTMVGIAVDGRAVAGIIHRPFEKAEFEKTFWGWKGHGVSQNLEKVGHDRAKESDIKIIVSRSHSGNVEKFARTALHTSDVQVIPAGGG